MRALRHRPLFLLLAFSLPILSQTITTLAGGGPNHLPATASNLIAPTAVAFDGAGNMYVADRARVYKVDTSGTLTVLAGDGNSNCNYGDGGPAVSAELNSPAGLAVDSQGDVFISDTCSYFPGSVIREVTPDGTISTIAGSTSNSGLYGDGGPAAYAWVNEPTALATDAGGDLFIADTGNGRIREIQAGTGLITSVAGGGAGATAADRLTLMEITGLAVDVSGNLYIASSAGTGFLIYRITLASGDVAAVAGGGNLDIANGLAGTAVSLPYVGGLTVDAAGNIYVIANIPDDPADGVFKLSAADGTFQALAGGGVNPLPGALGGSATAAQLSLGDESATLAVALAPDGSLALVVGDDNELGNVLRVGLDGTLSNLAGNFTSFYSGDGAPPADASLNGSAIALDTAGDIFIAADKRVREWVAATGKLTTVAGTGQWGGTSSGDGGPATAAAMNPGAVALDSSGNLFIGDGCSVREVAAATGTIVTIAANVCTAGGNTDTVVALLTGPDGSLYVATFAGVSKIAAGTGIISTVAGGGTLYGSAADGGLATAAALMPRGLALDKSGNLFITDGDWVREVVAGTGVIETVAGGGLTSQPWGDNGPAVGATLYLPAGLAFDANGNLYIADQGDNEVRRVDAVTGIITTVAGTSTATSNFTPSFHGDGGPALQAGLTGPADIKVDAAGNLYILDSGVRHLREVTGAAAAGVPVISAASLSFTQPVGTTSSPQTVLLSNPSGNDQNLELATTANFDWSDDCYEYLAPGASCAISVTFSPTTAGTISGSLTIDRDRGSPIVVELSGTGVAPSAPGFAPASLNFGSQVLGTSGQPALLSLVNSTGGALSLESFNTSVGFTQTNDCGASLDAGASCTVSVTFSPAAAGTAAGTLSVATATGPIVANLAGEGIAAPVSTADQANQIIVTLAGGGPNHLPATQAGLRFANATAYDSAGNLYVGDQARVFKITADGTLTVFAGNGVFGSAGDGGPAVDAELESVNGLAVDSSGDVFIAYLGLVRKVAPDGTISTYSFASAHALAVDPSGDLFLASGGNDQVLEISAATHQTTTVVGSIGGSTPALRLAYNAGSGLAVDGAGNLYVVTHDESLDQVNPATGAVTVLLPNAPGAITPSAIVSLAADPAGDVFMAARDGMVYELPYGSNQTVIVAGGVVGSAGRTPVPAAFGGAATDAQLYNPIGLSVAPTGEVAVITQSRVLSFNGDYVVKIASDGTLQPLAGNGTVTYAGDGGPPYDAELEIGTLAVDAAGDVYFDQPADARVREWVAATGKIQTVAGTGRYGHTGDGGPATQATIESLAVALDGSGNLLIGDGCLLRRVSAATGVITTIAGIAGGQDCGFSGDGGPATAAELGNISSLTVDPQGDIFLGDYDDGRIRKIAAGTGLITTVAGGGHDLEDGVPALSASIIDPYGLALDKSGNLYIADGGDLSSVPGRVRRVDAGTGVITTVAGGGTAFLYNNLVPEPGDGGPATEASLDRPAGVAVDAGGNIFIADESRVWRVDAATGIIQTTAGNGTPGFSGDGGAATQAQVFEPGSLALDATGNLFFSDTGDRRLRKVTHASGLPYLAPASVAFGSAAIGAQSEPQTATLTNTGAEPIAVSIAAGGDFAETDTCGGTVAADSSCTISISFNPTATGDRNGTLSVTDSAGSSPQAATLHGVGLAPAGASLSAASLTFSGQLMATASAPQTVTLTNPGGVALTVGTIAAGGDFTAGNDCGTSLAAGASCTLTVTFTPTAAGNRTGTLTLNDSAANSPQTVSLQGTGIEPPAALLSSPALTFGSQAVGSGSAAITVALSNPGGAPLLISGITATGDFSAVNGCGTSLAPGAGCSIAVTFTPTAEGSRSGALNIQDNAAGSPQTVALDGTGIAAGLNLAPGSLNFGGTAVGASTSQGLTISNTGATTLHVSSLAGSGDFTVAGNCAAIPAGAACSLSVTFTPSAAGTRNGVITITDDAADSPQTVPSTGQGQAAGAALSAARLTFPNTLQGSVSSPMALTLANSGATALSGISVALEGDFTETNTCTASLPAGAQCNIHVSFAPSLGTQETGTLSVTDSAGAQAISLSGQGVAPGATLSAVSLVFGSQPVNTVSSAQTLVLSNTGTADLSIASITSSAGFTDVTNCGTTLAAGAGCTIGVSFAPAAAGSQSGSVTVSDGTGTQTASLSGIGASPNLTLWPGQMDFGALPVGSTGSAQTVTVTNSGSAALTLAPLTVTGDFQEADLCPATPEALAPGASCLVSLRFTPGATGARSGTLLVQDAGGNNSAIVALGGTGTLPGVAAAPAALFFGGTPLGQTGPAQTVTVTNTGTAPLALAAVTAEGDFTAMGTCAHSTLAPGTSCVMSVAFAPTMLGAETGSLKILDDADGLHTVALNGSGMGPGVLLEPGQLVFGSQPIPGADSTGVTLIGATRPVLLTNSGNAALALSGITVQGPFSQSNNCGTSLAAGASCTLQISFAPTLAGQATGALTVSGANLGSPTVMLSGYGSPTGLTLSPPVLSFGSQSVGQPTAPETVALTNQTGSAVSGLSIVPSGEFSETDDCQGGLASGNSCTLQVTLTPLIPGSITGSLTISGTLGTAGSHAPGVHRQRTLDAGPAISSAGLAQVDLLATGGTGGVDLSATSLSFAEQATGTSSAPQSVNLTNSGSTAITGVSVSVSGDFTQTNTCGASVAAGATCMIAVVFTPTAVGTRPGAITISDSAADSPQSVSLGGSGTAPAPAVTLTPASLSFGPQLSGTASGAQTVTLANTGTAALTIPGITVDSDFTQTNTCGASVAAGAQCTISVVFTPTATGSRSGTLTITDDAADSPQTAALAGTGADLTMAAAAGGGNSATVSAGQTASYNLSFTPTGGLTGNFSLACTGAPTGATCAASPAKITLAGSPVAVKVTVSTTSRSGLTTPLGSAPPPGLLLLLLLVAALAAVVWMGASNSRRRWVCAAAALGAACVLVACGGSGSAPPPPVTSGTPAGTYTLTLTATSDSGATRSTSLILVVQ